MTSADKTAASYGIADAFSSRGVHASASMSAAFLCLCAFLVVYCLRPTDWIPGLASFPLAKVTGALAIAAFAISAMGSGRRIFHSARELVYLVVLFFQLCLAAVFSPVWRGGAFDYVLAFSKIVLITVVIAVTATTLTRLRKLIFVQASSAAIVAAVSLLKSQITAGRLSGALEGIYGNPNDLAFVIAFAWPLCLAFLLRIRNPLKKVVWALLMCVMVYALVRTFSRGGLIALIAAVAASLWEFGIKRSSRHLPVLAGLAMLAVLIATAPTGLERRLNAIFNPYEDVQAYGSFEQRRYLFLRSLEVTVEHPLFGVGPGNFPVVSGNWHVAHNSFTEISAEAGVPALILFLLMGRQSFLNTREAKRLARGEPEHVLLACGMRASLVAFAVGACFTSVEYHFFPYFLVAYTSALRRIAGGVDASEGKPKQSIRKADDAGQRAAYGSRSVA